MTQVRGSQHRVAGSGPDGGGTLGGEGGSALDARKGRWRWVKTESLLASELLALTAVAFSRPVLDSFGRSPETFIARQATSAEILVFGVVVLLLPALVVIVIGVAAGILARRTRWMVHLGLAAILAGVGAWRMVEDQIDMPGGGSSAVALGVVAAVVLGLLRWLPSTRHITATFLRCAGVASVVFLGKFLLISPTGSVAFGDDWAPNREVVDQIASDLGDDPPPVVVVIFDALPTMSLLDGHGRIDAAVYPNFAALADQATWYRNHTTVATFTDQAVPAILTGRYPDGEDVDRSRRETQNLFTLLGGAYDLHVLEPTTRLCPPSLCARRGSAGVRPLLGDALSWWRHSGSGEEEHVVELLVAMGPDRHNAAERWISELDVSSTRGADLYLLHAVLPHHPWQFDGAGTLYATPEDHPTGRVGFDGWSSAGTEVGRQAHLLQLVAADRLLGLLLDKLRAAGTYDDAVVVVTADHGDAFSPNDRSRALTQTNQAEVAWVPLLIKAPGQTAAVINDDNVMTIDIVPTVADLLDVDIPWDVDGIPTDRVRSERHPDRKLIADHRLNAFKPREGASFVEVEARRNLEEVLTADPTPHSGSDAIWKRGAHGELFGRALSDVRLGDPVDATVAVDWPANYDNVDPDKPLPLEVVASTDLEVGEVMAFALNGVVGALAEVQDMDRGIGNLVHGLMPPRLFVSGDNQLSAYLVEGPAGDETLRPIDIRF